MSSIQTRITDGLARAGVLGVRGLISYRRARSMEGHVPEGTLARLFAKGARHPLIGRVGSSDLYVFDQIFSKREYRCLDNLKEVGLILDLGANVGYSSAYFATRFPHAKIVAVEPDPENFELLKRNTVAYGRAVTTIRAGVWSHTACLKIDDNIYRGGGAWSRQVIECECGDGGFPGIDISSLIIHSGFDRVSILKMDIEGAESIVFGNNPHSWLEKVDNIVIEIHDDSSFGKASHIFKEAMSRYVFSQTISEELTCCIGITRSNF